MALVFDQQPNTYTPLYNQSPWVVRETDTSGSLNDWRMLCRVISLTNGTVEVARFNIRFRDNTQRRVVFDASEVLKGFVSYDHSAMTTAGPWLLAPNSIHWYVVNFQSQKYISGAWVTQNEFTPARRCVWNAALGTYAFAAYNSSNYVSVQNTTSKPLTAFTPNLLKLGTDESYWAHFLSGQEQSPLRFQITKYPLPNLQGTPLPADPSQSNPFSLSFTGFPSIDGNEYSRPRVRVGVGPRDLAAIASPISFAGVQSYKVVFQSATTGASTDVTWSFNVDNCHKYAPTRLHWLNRYGGFDAWTFDMKSYDEDSVERRQYKQQKNVLDGGTYGYGLMSRGTTDYHVKVEITRTISSDNLTDAELQHLRGIISSPVVFAEVSSGYTAVNVNTKSWRQKRGVQDGVFNLELEIQTSLDDYTQSL